MKKTEILVLPTESNMSAYLHLGVFSSAPFIQHIDVGQKPARLSTKSAAGVG
jgi:hypothetical protein